MKYFFIDLENVRNEGLEGVMLLGEEDRVFIFYSDNAYTLSIPTYESINNSKAASKYIKTNYIGKNAMDFQIVSLFGAMIERQKSGEFYIVSHDNGFKSAVSFCESYFTEYSITVGVYPTILAAIKSSMKGTDKAAAKTKSADAGQSGRNSGKKDKNMSRNDASAPAQETAAEKPAQTAQSSSAAAQEQPYAYIFEILKEILSEPTIALYAESIDAAVAASANRNELHANYLERCGSDEGEALFKVTQGDFEELKKRRPIRAEKTQAKPQRRRRRSRSSAAAAETPNAETSKAETPKAETPKAETSKAEASKAEAPKAENSKAKTPEAANPEVRDNSAGPGSMSGAEESSSKAVEDSDRAAGADGTAVKTSDKPRRRYYSRRRRKPKTDNGQKPEGGSKTAE